MTKDIKELLEQIVVELRRIANALQVPEKDVYLTIDEINKMQAGEDHA